MIYVNSSIYLSAGYGAGQVRQIVASSASQKTVSVSPSTPFKIFTILNVSNPLGTITPGYTAYQNIDNLNLRVNIKASIHKLIDRRYFYSQMKSNFLVHYFGTFFD